MITRARPVAAGTPITEEVAPRNSSAVVDHDASVAQDHDDVLDRSDVLARVAVHYEEYLRRVRAR